MNGAYGCYAGAVAGIWLLWLSCWMVFGDEIFGPHLWNWDQALAAIAAAFVALASSRRVARPYSQFMVAQCLGMLLLSLSWITYDPDRIRNFIVTAAPGNVGVPYSDISYAACVFVWVCGWGYLAIGLWQRYQPSALTRVVFAMLFFGLALILASFYYPEFGSSLTTSEGRLCAVTAGLEFLALLIGLISILLKVEGAVNLMFLAMALFIACDIGYSREHVPVSLNALWMSGQFLLAVSFLGLPGSCKETPGEPGEAGKAGLFRSDLSGILMLLSLSGLLMAVALGFMDMHSVWKSFFAVLFVVCLVVVQARLTDRFDESVQYLKEYAERLHRNRLEGAQWRSEPRGVASTLQSTGLGDYLDTLAGSARNLGKDVLFLGPERLYPEAVKPALHSRKSCFIVMPFSLEWSDDVHRILAGVCSSQDIRPMRGDDVFKPSDFLVDIWRGINDADFVIADISGRNPNVLYELGIAHTLAKPVLIISQSADDIPIDLSTRRVIIYGQQENRWQKELETKAGVAVKEIMKAYFADEKDIVLQAPQQRQGGSAG